MIFNSIYFISFLFITFTLFYGMRQQHRWLLLLCASSLYLAFSNPFHLIPLGISSSSAYLSSLAISRTILKKRNLLYIFLNSGINVVLLISLKYMLFFVNLLGISPTLPTGGIIENIIAPMGISFYVLQAIAYPIDVYRSRIHPEKHFGFFALYMVFFPKILAGPIERVGYLIPQFHKAIHLDYNQVRSGLRRILWGFFKKVVIADRLAFVVDRVYAAPESFGGVSLSIAVFFFLCKSILIFQAIPI